MRIWPAIGIGALVVVGLYALLVSGRLWSPAHASPADTQAVSMTQDLRFVPDPIMINVGTTVTWTDVTATIPHTTTSDTGVWDSGTVNPGGVFSFTFNTPGTFAYHCAFHKTRGMVGTITVLAPTSTTTPTASATGTVTSTPT